MRDIKDLSQEALAEYLLSQAFPAFHARQIFTWLYQRQESDFNRMSDLPLTLRHALARDFTASSMVTRAQYTSGDGTQKFLLQLADGQVIESVRIPVEGRVTGCLSTQVGCKFACSFCASGILGFKRNLSLGEILEQLVVLKRGATARDEALSHVVFMGTGEPLDNYDNVLAAIRVINDKNGFAIGARRMTLSSAGFIPGIMRLSEEKLQVELSVSLHAADDMTRNILMPINKKYPLKTLLAACRTYALRTGRQVTFEYIVLHGVNSRLQDARNLSIMMRNKYFKVNLIPANPVPELGVAVPGKLEVLMLKDYLVKRGVHVTVRKSRGEDISAACGQLRLQAGPSRNRT